MKIKFTKPAAGIGFAYPEGAEVELIDKQAKLVIKKGYAELLDDFEGDLPADFPGRETLAEAGINTVDEVLKIADLTEINGIGKKTAERIAVYVVNMDN